MYFRSQRKLSGEVSLSETLEAGGDDQGLSLMDVLAVEDDMLEQLHSKQSCKQVLRCVRSCLNDRERDIIIQRYGLDRRPPRTQREVAQGSGISRSYVSRIEKRALEKLRTALEGCVE